MLLMFIFGITNKVLICVTRLLNVDLSLIFVVISWNIFNALFIVVFCCLGSKLPLLILVFVNNITFVIKVSCCETSMFSPFLE